MPEPPYSTEPKPEALRDQELADAGLEPGDAYLEAGLLVFTAQFHQRRGYCCNSGCRHCPYRTA